MWGLCCRLDFGDWTSLDFRTVSLDDIRTDSVLFLDGEFVTGMRMGIFFTGEIGR